MSKWPASCPAELFPRVRAIMEQRDKDPNQVWAEVVSYLEELGAEPPEFPASDELDASKD